MSDELIPEDHYLYGREGVDEGRLARARAGLPEEVEEGAEEEAWEGLGAREEPSDAQEAQYPEKEAEEPSLGVVILLPVDALERWARWHTEEGPNAVRILPRGLDRPSRPYGAAIGAQVAALVEGTEGFLLVERRLRIEWGLPPARDALPTVPPGMPTALVLMAMPLFLAALDAELPREFFPPRVVAGIEIEQTPLEGEEEAQEAIDARWRAMYPATWRR